MKRRTGDASVPMPFKAVRAKAGWRVTIVGVVAGRPTELRHALELSILVPVLATPDGNLVGFGVVTRRGDTLVITS